MAQLLTGAHLAEQEQVALAMQVQVVVVLVFLEAVLLMVARAEMARIQQAAVQVHQAALLVLEVQLQDLLVALVLGAQLLMREAARVC